MDTDTLETWVGWEKIARRAGCSVSAVKRAIHGDPRRPERARGLIALGLLRIVKHGGRCRGDTNRYRGVLPTAKEFRRNDEEVPREPGSSPHGPQNSAMNSVTELPDEPVWDDIRF
jgi:hypothetical protein